MKTSVPLETPKEIGEAINPLNINRNIKTLRVRKDITQEQLAKVLQLKVKTVEAYEQGRALPKIKTLCKLSDYFGVPIDDIIRKELKILSF
jgi:DNA-binding XRE family transcriptional regulator